MCVRYFVFGIYVWGGLVFVVLGLVVFDVICIFWVNGEFIDVVCFLVILYDFIRFWRVVGR